MIPNQERALDIRELALEENRGSRDNLTPKHVPLYHCPTGSNSQRIVLENWDPYREKFQVNDYTSTHYVSYRHLGKTRTTNYRAEILSFW